MAVQQISQIQIRRGLLQDLGQLASGEFGWALDQLRLFIGNGSLLEGAPYEGNTEIMTKNGVLNIINTALGATGSSGASGATGSTGAEIGLFYRFKGLEGGYEAQTGVDPNNHTIRSLQNKLDDIINVLDFGAVGDDITDDLDAIQRAIDQVYNRLENYTDEKTRRVIHFHPGIYKIYGELRIPPYCVLRGAGKDSVVIKQASPAATCVIKTTTSEGNYDSFIPTEGEPPGPVEISNITFEFNTMPGKSIARIESSRNVKFHRCKFTSSTIQPSVDDNDVAIRIQSNYLTTSAIHFSECDIQGVSTGVLISDNYRIQDIVFDRCTFTDLYQGIVAYTNKSYAILGLKVVNCIFDAIKAYGILGFDNVCGITSSTNTYLNVGTNFTSNISSPLGQPMPRYSIRGDSIYNDIMVSDVDSGDGFNLNITSIDLIETLVYRIVDWVDSSPEHLDRGNLVMSSYEPTLNNHTPITPVIKFSGNACFSFGDFFFRSRDDDYLVDTIEHTASDIISFDLTSAIKYGETYQTIGRSVVLQPNTVNFIPLLSKYFGGIIDYRVERFSRYRSGTVNFSVDPINNIVCWRDSFTERFSTAVFIEMEYNNFLSQTRVQRPILIVKVDNTDGPTIFSYDVKGLVDDNIGLPDLSIPWIRPPAVYALLATADCSVEGAGFILKITGKNVPDCANGRRFKITANANNLDLPLGSGYYIVARQTIDLDYLLTEAGPGTTIFFSVHSLDRYENLIYSIEDYSSGSSLPPTTTGYEHIFDTNVLPTTVDVKVREDFKTEGLEQVEFKLYTWCIGDPESTDAVAEDCALICDTSLTPPITPTPSPTPSISPSPAPTITPKPTPTPSRSIAPTPTPSMSSLPTPTPTPTATATRTPTPTPTSTPSLSPGVSSTPAPTPSPTASSTPTPTPTATPSQSAGATPTPTPTRTNTPTPSPTRSNTPTPTPTRSKSCDIVPTISISGTTINARNSCAQDNTILTLTIQYNRPISLLTALRTNTPYMGSCIPPYSRFYYRSDQFNDSTTLQPISAPGSGIIFWGPEIVSGTTLRYKFSASSSSTPGTYTIKMAPGGRAVTPGQCQNGLSFFESNSVTVTITK